MGNREKIHSVEFQKVHFFTLITQNVKSGSQCIVTLALFSMQNEFQIFMVFFEILCHCVVTSQRS